MRIEEIKLEAGNAKRAKLTVYSLDQNEEIYGNRKRTTVLICPGGGYNHVSVREGEPIAMQFLSFGCNAAVLWYDVMDDGAVFPQHLMELATAVSYLRSHADEYHITEDNILVCGFSAGGHLAASLGCFWNTQWLETEMKKAVGVTKDAYRPNGLILGYPVITSGEFAHRGSFECMLQEKLEKGCEITGFTGKELEEYLSLEKQVTKDTPATFMWHTFEDGAVPLENSLLFALALKENGVKFEYHVFPNGGHGYALGTRETSFQGGNIDPQIPAWTKLCKNWIEQVTGLYTE